MIENRSIPGGIYILTGPTGVGKTMYCRQFIADGLRIGDTCVFVSSSLTENHLRNLFASLKSELMNNLKFINPCQISASQRDVASRILHTAEDIGQIIEKVNDRTNMKRSRRTVRIVIDSLTQFSLLGSEKAMLKFIMGLSVLLREIPVTAICTSAALEDRLQSSLGSFATGILEMKLDEDVAGTLRRRIRLLSVKGVHHNPSWIEFKIADSGDLIFGDQPKHFPVTSCTLCGKAIKGPPLIEFDLFFDTLECVGTYKKLLSVYGSNASQPGLSSGAFTASFFFIDIVGLSDPSLSVRKQIQKIEILNKLVGSCTAFKAAEDKRIILPTGDGMVIGFLLNPELPIELSIELHQKLRSYNSANLKDDHIGIRIGLASGIVFQVWDMNDIQNVWGPGIILARRVMDAGDDEHILLADKLAEELIALKDEYRKVIRPICDSFEIKHGQKIRLYSAYSTEFGNPKLPAKVPRIG